MRRVLYVIHGPTFGGAHMQVLRLRRPLAERGWDAVALLPTEPGNALARLREGGVDASAMKLHRLRATADPLTHARLLAGLWPEVRSIRSLIREREIDVVQVHGPTNPHGAIAAHMERKAVVWQLLDVRAPMVLRRLTMPLVTRLADSVTTWGVALAREHPGAAALGDRLFPIVPPVEADEFQPEGRDAARAELRIPPGSFVLGTVGVRNPQKGHEYLVRAAAEVRARHPELMTRILGAPSPAHPHYEERVRGEAARLGVDIPHALDLVEPGGRVPQLLPALDVFAMTSVPRSEGMPTAILEAMASGLPVVATDVGAVAELVEDGVTGFVVEANDVDAIAAAITRLIDNPELRAAMGAEGRRRARERYGLSAVVDTHVRAFEAALAHRARRYAERG